MRTQTPLTLDNPNSPGRWFVAHQMKILLAYVVTHYDIEPLDHRPLNRVIGDSVIPPQNVSIKVRRRKDF